MILVVPPARAWPYRLTAAALLVGVALVRLAYLAWFCPLDLAPDEAHYWDWSRHLDWSYYSKGPLVAWLIRASCALFGTSAFAVRVPAVLCGSLLLAGLYALTAQVYRCERLALGVVLVALTLPVVAAGSVLMTIDAPYTCCWCWALVFGFHAVFARAAWAWPAAGLCILLGVLAKHTMVLWVPCLGLFLLLTPALRPLLWRPGFWVMTGLGALGGVPILVWNALNGWVTLRHTQGHAGLDGGPTIHWKGPAVYLGMQFAVLLGFWFIAWVRASWDQRPGRAARPEVGYLWWMSVPIVAFFGLFSLKNGGGEPNWPIAGYLSGLVLTAAWLREQLRHPDSWQRRLTAGSLGLFVALGLTLTVLSHFPQVLQPLLPASVEVRRVDPTCRLRGWRTLAASVDAIRQTMPGDVVMAASAWNLPGELGFYCDGRPAVYSFGPALGDRHSQYDLWRPNPLADPGAPVFAGKSFIVIGATPEILREAFDTVGPMTIVSHREGARTIATWAVTTAHGYRGFPGREGSRGY